MISTLVAASANVILNYLFILRFGYLAASYTTLVSYILLAIMQYIFMRNVHPERVYDMRFIVILSGGLVGLTMLCLKLYAYTAVRYGIVLVFLAAAFVCRKRLAELFYTLKKKGKEKE